MTLLGVASPEGGVRSEWLRACWGLAVGLKGLRVERLESSVSVHLRAERHIQMGGSGFRVSGFGFQISGLDFWVSVFGFRVSFFGFRVLGFDFPL